MCRHDKPKEKILRIFSLGLSSLVSVRANANFMPAVSEIKSVVHETHSASQASTGGTLLGGLVNGAGSSSRSQEASPSGAHHAHQSSASGSSRQHSPNQNPSSSQRRASPSTTPTPTQSALERQAALTSDYLRHSTASGSGSGSSSTAATPTAFRPPHELPSPFFASSNGIFRPGAAGGFAAAYTPPAHHHSSSVMQHSQLAAAAAATAHMQNGAFRK